MLSCAGAHGVSGDGRGKKKPKHQASVFGGRWRQVRAHYFLMRITGVSPTVTAPVISNMDEIKELVKMTGAVTVGETPVIRIKK
jgi:hypothetical protein